MSNTLIRLTAFIKFAVDGKIWINKSPVIIITKDRLNTAINIWKYPSQVILKGVHIGYTFRHRIKICWCIINFGIATNKRYLVLNLVGCIIVCRVIFHLTKIRLTGIDTYSFFGIFGSYVLKHYGNYCVDIIAEYDWIGTMPLRIFVRWYIIWWTARKVVQRHQSSSIFIRICNTDDRLPFHDLGDKAIGAHRRVHHNGCKIAIFGIQIRNSTTITRERGLSIEEKIPYVGNA